MQDTTAGRIALKVPVWIEDRLVFDIEGPDGHFKPYFKCESLKLDANMDTVLLMTVLLAMYHKLDIVSDTTVSKTLLSNVEQLSRIFSGWFPEYAPLNLSKVPSHTAAPGNTGRVGSFFTGGADSFYTFFKNRDEITDLIYVHGYDVQLDDYPRRKEISEMGRKIAAESGIRFIEIETDSQKLFRTHGEWALHSHGIALGTVGHLLAGHLDKIYIPSSHAQQDLIPWGSHPDTDPLLSGDRVQFTHDGCDLTRVEKIQAIKDSEAALSHLRVCWERVEGAYNCGVCEKCLRTMTSLYAVGALDKCKTFPHEIDLKKINRIWLKTESVRGFANENLKLLEAHGLQASPVYASWKKILNRTEFENWCVWRYRRSYKKLKSAMRKVFLGKAKIK